MEQAKQNRFLCVLPWNHLFVANDGRQQLCCLSQARFDQSENLSQIQNEMLSGSVPKACSFCLKVEATGKSSYRHSVNSQFSETFAGLSEKTEPQLEFIDLRLGNSCNLKCRMCSPSSSRALNKEFNSFYGTQDNLIHDFDFTLFDNIKDRLRKLKRVNLAGGEPFMSDQGLKLLQRLIEMNLAKQIEITINSNMTFLPKHYIEALKKFRSTKIVASVDGLEKVNSYIRYPSVWGEILKNIEEAQAQNFNVAINCTVQNYNIFCLPEFIDFFYYDRQIPIYLNFLENPSFLNIQFLPDHIKDRIAKKFRNYLASKESDLVGLEASIAYMRQKKGDHKENERFIAWTQHLDVSRKQNLRDVIPEIADFAVPN